MARGAPMREGVFPITGRHTYGGGIGAGRGQDALAKCGTPLVAL